VCCNHWGQCGLNQDFCAITTSETGAPGTTTCISNCGNEIIKSNPPPASQIRIAYFGAWNDNRPCLNMRVDQIDKSKYTHIHFAFADITPDTFQVDISKVQHQFNIFKTMTGIQRIISFGGWDFSALEPTYRILRNAVKPENRNTFRNNLLKFVEDHGLDGVDLDWEYPGVCCRDFPSLFISVSADIYVKGPRHPRHPKGGP
jgi:GH18 family chitinase